MVRIIPYHPRLAADFDRLNREWLERYFTVEREDLKYLEDPDGTILGPGGEIFFAVEDEVVLGTCAAIPRSDGSFELAKLAVTPAAQGRGLGRALSQAVIDFARRRRAPMVVLCSNSRLTPALKLYRSLGFQVRPFPTPPVYADADVYMELELHGPASSEPAMSGDRG